MIHAQEARISCQQCNGWYNSESELYAHMQTVHRRCVPQESVFSREVSQRNGFDNHPPTPKKEWTEPKRLKEKHNFD